MTPPGPSQVPRSGRLLLARGLIAFLIGLLGLVIYLSLNPPALAALVRAAPIPGSVAIPTPGPTPPLPPIAASPGPLPEGFLAYTGAFNDGLISCGFLLDLGEHIPGARVGISAAHASPRLPDGETAEFYDPAGNPVALLTGQVAFGETFIGEKFTLDYVLWSVEPEVDPDRFLRPDPRSLVQPGELVYLYAPVSEADGIPLRWPGVVISAGPDAVWIQLEESFSPLGYSGCPVVSRITGRLIGMAVAGADMPTGAGGAAAVVGLHPAASLVEKARTALH